MACVSWPGYIVLTVLAGIGLYTVWGWFWDAIEKRQRRHDDNPSTSSGGVQE